MPKRISDLPQFVVTETREGVLHRGYIRVNLVGKFKSLEGVEGERCSMIRSNLQSIWCEPLRFDAATGNAIYLASLPEIDDMSGEALAFVSNRFDGQRVTMIADESNTWTKSTFQASDALSRSIISKSGQNWIETRKADSRQPSSKERIVKGGWDHEHCKLCNRSIWNAQVGYIDSSDRWLCESCYDRYARSHDLSFFDQL